MSQVKTYEAIIIGGGKAGKTLAMDLAKQGKKIALIEQNQSVGGTCINVGCIPTKTLVASANLIHKINHAKQFGVDVSSYAVNFEQIKQRKRSVVSDMSAGNLKMFLQSGMDLIFGKARFVGMKEIEVDLLEPINGESTQRIKSDKIFINTGGLPFIPPVPGLEHVNALTNETLMELNNVPKHLLIMGGGYIGLEFGQMFRRFGAEVTIVERSSVFIPLEDRDIADEVQKTLEAEGIKILLNREVVRVEGDKQQAHLIIREPNQTQEEKITGTDVLVAVGRIPNTKDLNLDATCVKTDARGFVEVNEFLETSVPGIWALGDVKGGPQFTHLSLDDYRIVKDNLSQNSNVRTSRGRLIPYTVFIDPELARVGLTEQAARQQGYEVKVAKIAMAAIPRAKTLGETKGFMKAVIDAKTNLILGASLFCVEAGEVLCSIQVAMMANLPYTALRDGMFAHPTVAEGLNNLFAGV